MMVEQTEDSGGPQATWRHMIEKPGHELLGRECEEHLVVFVGMFVGDAKFAVALTLDPAF